MKNNKNKNNDIAIFHHHDEIDKNSITICNEIKLFHDDNIDHDIIKLWNKLTKKPKLIVFDLDLTLWPFWVDTHVRPPFKRITNDDDEHTIIDQDNKNLTFYADVPKILNTLRNFCFKNNGYLAVASRTSEYIAATQLLELYNWKDYFDSIQMYSGTKIRHITHICNELSINDKKDVLFFDDEHRNIVDTVSLGVTAYHLDMKYGLTKDDCLKGLNMHEIKN